MKGNLVFSPKIKAKTLLHMKENSQKLFWKSFLKILKMDIFFVHFLIAENSLTDEFFYYDKIFLS